MLKHNGIFVVFEGLNCSGKTTQIELLKNNLRSHFSPNERNLFLTAQPGATADSYDRLKRKKALGLELTIADYMRDRLYHSPHLDEALHRGDIVICSRYTASTAAYQGNLDPEMLEYIRRENKRVTHGLVPDLVIYLCISPSEALRRLQERNRPGDDNLAIDQLYTIDAGYARELNYCARKGQEWLIVDAQLSVEEVADRILAAVNELIQSKTHALP
jgi:dTMP kinase